MQISTEYRIFYSTHYQCVRLSILQLRRRHSTKDSGGSNCPSTGKPSSVVKPSSLAFQNSIFEPRAIPFSRPCKKRSWLSEALAVRALVHIAQSSLPDIVIVGGFRGREQSQRYHGVRDLIPSSVDISSTPHFPSSSDWIRCAVPDVEARTSISSTLTGLRTS